jgi:hypothetical protein
MTHTFTKTEIARLLDLVDAELRAKGLHKTLDPDPIRTVGIRLTAAWFTAPEEAA